MHVCAFNRCNLSVMLSVCVGVCVHAHLRASVIDVALL